VTQLDSMELLRDQVRQTSQAEVARRIGYSPSAVCQVLKGTYPNSVELLVKVEEVYNRTATIDCPIVGPITPGKCAEHRNRAFAATNPVRVALFHRCPECKGKP
jgi:transcriptional regulator with XRE-family HTH domain